MKAGLPVVGVGTWDVHGVQHVTTAPEAIDRIESVLRD